MKIIFNRKEGIVETKLDIDSEEQDFDYLTLINKLLEGVVLEDPQYPEDVSEDEKNEIDEMIAKINEVMLQSASS